MIDKDMPRFCDIHTALAENFSAKITSSGLNFRYEALKEYSIEQIEMAAIDILKHRTFMGMPPVAIFIESIEGTQVLPKDIANMQILEIMNQIRDIGYYGIPIFNDLITRNILASRWSWTTLCSMTEKELTWWAKDFVNTYCAASATKENLDKKRISHSEKENKKITYEDRK